MTASFLAAWWMQGIVIAALLAGTAALLQWIARDTVPARAIWGAAMLGATVLTFIAPFRLTAPAPDAGTNMVQGMLLPVEPTDSPSFGIARVANDISESLRAALQAPMQFAADAVREFPGSIARGALGAWAIIAAALLMMLAVSHRRLRRLLGVAEQRDIAGVPVRLTADLGPAVVGIRAPVVAVPRWLLELPLAEQALVVRHEQSHVAARDPLLLMSGVALAAMQPWNPFVWLMLSRLRLAIELDCDRRLLRHGTSPRAYGDLLIALSAAASPAASPALIHPMFSIHRSHLAQRIIAMTERPVRLITARRAAVAAFATLAFVAACESRLPTDAEVREMDAETAVRSVAAVTRIDTGALRFIVDGKPVTGEVARGIAADKITELSVDGGRSLVYITTDDSVSPLARIGEKMAEVRVEGRPIDASMVVREDGVNPRILRRSETVRDKEFSGLFIVDGVRTDPKQATALTPDRIESVSVVKGAAAREQYGEAGANGVILIKTKPRR